MRVEFPKEQCNRMRRAVSAARRREIGGILMAEQLAPGSFRIVDFSIDPVAGDAAHFVRSTDHHQRALAEFFDRVGAEYTRFNYLGEWHSHPNHPPIPSTIDIRSMMGLVQGERNIPFAALLVVKAKFWRRLECSLTFFARGKSPKAAELISTD